MAALRFDQGGTPWARAVADENTSAVAGLRCPYCGGEAVLLSHDDFAEDDLHLELYCDNSQCDVREFTVLAMRANEPYAGRRADVAALRAVDDGSEGEGPELGAQNVGAGRIHSFAEVGQLTADHLRNTVARRRRPSRVRVEPLPPEKDR